MWWITTTLGYGPGPSGRAKYASMSSPPAPTRLTVSANIGPSITRPHFGRHPPAIVARGVNVNRAWWSRPCCRGASLIRANGRYGRVDVGEPDPYYLALGPRPVEAAWTD